MRPSASTELQSGQREASMRVRHCFGITQKFYPATRGLATHINGDHNFNGKEEGSQGSKFGSRRSILVWGTSSGEPTADARGLLILHNCLFRTPGQLSSYESSRH